MTDTDMKERIGFTYTDPDGTYTSADAELNPSYEDGETYLSVCIEKFHGFLAFCGYLVRDCFLAEPLTHDEMFALEEFLEEYRKKNDLHSK